MTLVIPRGQTAQPGPRGGQAGTPRRPSWGSAAGRPGPRGDRPGAAAAQYKRSPMATEGHRASE